LQMVMQLAGTAAVAGITQNYIRLQR